MNLLSPIDNYCERIDSSIFSEPLNLITNLSFLIVSYLLWKNLRKKSPIISVSRMILVGLVFAIGIGSALFHSFGNNLTKILDVLPIAIFVAYYLYWLIRSQFKASHSQSFFWIIMFAIFSIGIARISDSMTFNGSELYFGTLLTLVGFTVYFSADKGSKNLFIPFLIATISFSFSLISRTIDMSICPSFPLGSHFIWHICNALTIYYLTNSLLEDQKFSGL